MKANLVIKDMKMKVQTFEGDVRIVIDHDGTLIINGKTGAIIKRVDDIKELTVRRIS